MKLDIRREIEFRTARSGGKGGQHVNKVETMVEGGFWVAGSTLLTDEQKELIIKKLSRKINSDGFLKIRSQAHRSQLANKEEVIEKMNDLVNRALEKRKKRKATRPAKSAVESRLESKKKKSSQKQNRKKIRLNDI